MDKQGKVSDQTVKDAIKATMQGMVNWLASDSVIIQDKRTGELLPNAEIESRDRISPLKDFIIPELEKYGIIYSTNEDQP